MVAPSSRLSVGRATLTIVLSTTTRKTLMTSTARMDHRRRWMSSGSMGVASWRRVPHFLWNNVLQL